MPRIVLNATTLIKGGVLQTSLNFIRRILVDPAEFDWRFVLSAQLAKELERSGSKLPADVVIFENSPARHFKERKRLRELVDSWNPDGVFTFGGPAYVRFAQPHLLGCTEPWVSHAGWTAYRMLDFPFAWIKNYAGTVYKRFWFRKADRWVTQTEIARQGMARKLGVPLERIDVVGNACGAFYFARADERRPFPAADRVVRLFCFTAPYPHKNLRILPSIAVALRKRLPDLRFEIVVTLPPDGDDWRNLQAASARLGIADRIVNLGPIALVDGPAAFAECDLLLLPTVLETFSATYPQAMAMGLPIVTSDLNFARDVCGDAGLYYSPRDPLHAAEKIQELLDDETLWNRLIDAGKIRLAQFPRPAERAAMLLEALRKLSFVERG